MYFDESKMGSDVLPLIFFSYLFLPKILGTPYWVDKSFSGFSLMLRPGCLAWNPIYPVYYSCGILCKFTPGKYLKSPPVTFVYGYMCLDFEKECSNQINLTFCLVLFVCGMKNSVDWRNGITIWITYNDEPQFTPVVTNFCHVTYTCKSREDRLLSPPRCLPLLGPSLPSGVFNRWIL